MSQADHITQIRAFLAHFDNDTWESVSRIAAATDIPELQARSALAQMVGQGLAQSRYVGGVAYYARSSAFIWRKITPLFAGTPEFIVETYEGRLCCWCPSEFDARIIADALQRS